MTGIDFKKRDVNKHNSQSDGKFQIASLARGGIVSELA